MAGLLSCFFIWRGGIELGIHLMDSNGVTISSLTQWDYNITLIIEETGFSSAPMFHFSNQNSDRSLPVQSTLGDNGKISVEIPNDLLREALKISVYVFVESGDSGRTVEILQIPVRTKAQPLDYEYSDNLEIIHLDELKEEMEAATEAANSAADSANSAASNLDKIKEEAIQATTDAVTATSQANSARDSANSAADAANEAAQDAEDAKQGALDAKEAAETATTQATNAATSANNATEDAIEATSQANAAKNAANAAATAANNAVTQANTARDQANNAATAANTATSQANTARDQANAAASAAQQAADEVNEILDDINNVMAVTLIDDVTPATNKTYSSQFIETNFRWEAATTEEVLAILD